GSGQRADPRPGRDDPSLHAPPGRGRPADSASSGLRGQRGVAGFTTRRGRMVDTQLVARGIRHPAVLRAMATVPRERFVHELDAPDPYEDSALPIGQAQTISQPYVVALMLEAIDPEPTDRVLEIGTGSGYAAAVLAEVVAEVYTIERLATLAAAARAQLAELGYRNVHVLEGDGTLGWPEHGPYDGIIVTAGGAGRPGAAPASAEDPGPPGGSRGVDPPFSGSGPRHPVGARPVHEGVTGSRGVRAAHRGGWLASGRDGASGSRPMRSTGSGSLARSERAGAHLPARRPL